jgi:hypothetical protein
MSEKNDRTVEHLGQAPGRFTETPYNHWIFLNRSSLAIPNNQNAI